MRRGDVWWADLGPPSGSGPGFRRPVVIVQADLFNLNGMQTVIVAILTSNERLARAPGNVMVSAALSGLKKDSVVNVTQLFTIDEELLSNHVGSLPPRVMRVIDNGLRMVLAL